MIRKLLFLAFLSPLVFPSVGHAIVDPAQMYQEMENRISEVKDSNAQVSDALVSVNLTKKERAELKKWKASLEEEQKILEERLELLKGLQRSGMISYINPPAKKK